MEATRLVDRARSELAGGRHRAALRCARQAVQRAIADEDEGPVRDAEELARDIARVADGGVRHDAEQLAAYCRALLDGVGGGVRAPGIVERTVRGIRRRPDEPP